jgi:hypothetical protein
MASGTPTDDSPAASGPAKGAGAQSSTSGSSLLSDSIPSTAVPPISAPPGSVAPSQVSFGFDDQQWRDANRVFDRRYLELGRAQIDEMCLDLKARLAARMSAGLQDRLAAEGPAPDLANPEAGRQIEAAAAMAAKLLDDVSWMLPWDQAKSLVEPYAKGSWLLAQIQVVEEQRIVAIFAAELMSQATSYMRELIFRFYGADEAEPMNKLAEPARKAEEPASATTIPATKEQDD